MTMTTALEAGRPPQQVRNDLWLFPPNRDCQGGSSWWLNIDPEPVLIDCPPLTQATITALKELAANRQARILLTSREGHGRLRRLQEQLDWPVLVQEQEAYLLPNVERLDCFKMSTPQPVDCVCFGPLDQPQAVPLCWRRPQLSFCSAGVC
jgi:hypothetical protein